MLIDSHCHLTYDELAGQLDDVLARAADAGVSRIITIATDLGDAIDAVDILAKHPQVCMAAGIHPHEAAKCLDYDLDALDLLHREAVRPELARRLVAVGETGLDYHYDFAPPDRQEVVFRRQLAIACDLNKPVIIHARKSESRVCEILADYPVLRDRVVFHCFSAEPDLALRVLDMGFYLSFTGVVTFANADNIRESARAAPIDRIMVETDAPFLSPVPVRKIRPNEPAFVSHTARFLADLRGMPFDAFAERTTANAIRFFGLPEVSS